MDKTSEKYQQLIQKIRTITGHDGTNDELPGTVQGIVEETYKMRYAILQAASWLLLNSDGRSRGARAVLDDALRGRDGDPLTNDVLRLNGEINASRRALLEIESRVRGLSLVFPMGSEIQSEIQAILETCKYRDRPRWSVKFKDGDTPPSPSLELDGTEPEWPWSRILKTKDNPIT